MADEEGGASDAEEREQAPGGSGEAPVPGSESTAQGDAGKAGQEVTDAREEGAGSAEGAAHPGVAQSAAVQVPEAHETGVADDFRAEVEEIMSR